MQSERGASVISCLICGESWEVPQAHLCVDGAHPDACPTCNRIMKVGMYPAACKGDPAYHTRKASYRPFPEYEVDLGAQGKVRITSLQDAQRLERQTEQAYRNGERDRAGKLIGPVVLRAFHQNQSNLDKPVWDPPHYRKPSLRRRGGAGRGDE